MTTTVLARLLLHLRRTELSFPAAYITPSSSSSACFPTAPLSADEQVLWDRRRSRAISPFGLVPLLRPLSSTSVESERPDSMLEPESALELEPPEQVHNYHYRKRMHDPSKYPLSERAASASRSRSFL